MNERTEGILVCEYADAPLAVAGTVFSHTCIRCGARLMVAPTGQRILREHPKFATLCKVCYARDTTVPDHGYLAGTPEEIAQECISARPNPRRTRN